MGAFLVSKLSAVTSSLEQNVAPIKGLTEVLPVVLTLPIHSSNKELVKVDSSPYKFSAEVDAHYAGN